FLRTHLPAAGVHDHSATCLYTLTPDRDLVSAPSPATTAPRSPPAPPPASSSPPCSAGSWPTLPCTAAPTSTSPRSPSTARPSPPPTRRPATWSDDLVGRHGEAGRSWIWVLTEALAEQVAGAGRPSARVPRPGQGRRSPARAAGSTASSVAAAARTQSTSRAAGTLRGTGTWTPGAGG